MTPLIDDFRLVERLAAMEAVHLLVAVSGWRERVIVVRHWEIVLLVPIAIGTVVESALGNRRERLSTAVASA